MKVCFATSRETKNLIDSDRLLSKSLIQEGFNVEVAVWNDTQVEWSDYNCVVIRSCWDYHLKYLEFLNWLDNLDSINVKILNSTSIIRDNINKIYLQKLDKAGVSVVPTLWFEKGNNQSIDERLQSKGWKDIVIKPLVGATSHGLIKTRSEDIMEQLNPFPSEFEEGFMIQKFMPEIESEGEWSLVFFGRDFSHAVRKKNATGDFRVQKEYGGKHYHEEPDEVIINQARSILLNYPDELLYARVDGVQLNGTFMLMELELAEPELFINHGDHSKLFVDRILQLIRS